MNNFPNINNCKISIIGLGYVGLPLAIEFAKRSNMNKEDQMLDRRIIGFDINEERLNSLKESHDNTREINSEELNKTKDFLYFTSQEKELLDVDVFIITVPTPITKFNIPDLSALKSASETVGKVLRIREMKSNPIVIYESTVYPGATEDFCIPILEKTSGLKKNIDFFVGYSPERINPGDKKHSLKNIIKVTSGSTTEAAKWIDELYSTIIEAGTHLAPNIKVAEAAKVIENTQRDLNIALINELAIIFSKMNIDTLDVLEAAETKWNFLSFRPGLVGGHCIRVDPYYLTYKATELGYYPEVVLSGRRVNENMSKWIIEKLLLEMVQKGKANKNAKVLILGITFKENCPDTRNSKIIDMIEYLKKYNINPKIVDPVVNIDDCREIYDIEVKSEIEENYEFDALITAVAHDQFINYSESLWSKLITENTIAFDLKGIIPRSFNTIRL